MTEEIAMPEDWNDHEGWERYYASLFPNDSRISHEILIKEILKGDESLKSHLRAHMGFTDNIDYFSRRLKKENVKTIWVSGCGISLVPKLLIRAGFTIHATDISPTAIEFQKSNEAEIENILDKIIEPSDSSGSLLCELHDFRQPYLENYFDSVINVRAFQRFDYNTMKQIAMIHYNSLKPSRTAFFHGTNLRGEYLDSFKESLRSAGFFIPEHEVFRWFSDYDHFIKHLETNSPEFANEIRRGQIAKEKYLSANPDTKIVVTSFLS